MSTFKAGDRVRVYGGTNSDEGEFFDGSVREVQSNWLTIKDDRNGEVVSSFHSKQCRKLVKKERRRLFVEMQPGTSSWGNICPQPFKPVVGFELVEFVEVRKRK